MSLQLVTELNLAIPCIFRYIYAHSERVVLSGAFRIFYLIFTRVTEL
ncbi:MAG: hypothetical protein J7647_07660 [Cyanobacteria bacterium SBLK]|nr:hypothetical protein [Cyanobacteria bacterium SBLK]